MAKRKSSRRSSASAKKRRGSSSCVKAADCGLVVARTSFKSAKSCSTRQQAADVFRAAAARKFRTVGKAEKSKLFKEALRMQARAAQMCGDEAKAARIQAALRSRDSSDGHRNLDPSYTSSFEGWRGRGRRRGRRRRR